MSMYCSKCGAQSSEGDVFCRTCGLPLNQTTPTTPTPTPTLTPQAGAYDQRIAGVQRTSGLVS
jgi:hypothetical protein